MVNIASSHGSWKIETSKITFRKGKPSKNQSFMTLGCSNRKYFTTEPDIAILYTPWKFNSSPLKKDGWFRRSFPIGFRQLFRGFSCLTAGGFLLWEADIEMGRMKWETWYIRPWNLPWNLKITCLKRKILFQTFIFGFHVNFQGCIYDIFSGWPLEGFTPSWYTPPNGIGFWHRFHSPKTQGVQGDQNGLPNR